jgi:hypothetical protein
MFKYGPIPDNSKLLRTARTATTFHPCDIHRRQKGSEHRSIFNFGGLKKVVCPQNVMIKHLQESQE